MTDYTEHVLDITADDKIFTPRGVGALNIGVVQCLSELVANSLDWRRLNATEIESIKRELEEDPENRDRFIEAYGKLVESNPIKTRIEIRFTGEAIEISDNGIGMTVKDVEIGLRLRAASDELRIPLRSRKGMFGMGMKVGILGMGWKFTIRTRSLFEQKETELVIDTREIESGHLTLSEIKCKVFQSHDLEGPLGDRESGTYIMIEDLHKKKHNLGTWRVELGRNFTPELEYGDVEIVVIDARGSDETILESCKPQKIEIDPDTVVALDPLDLQVRPDYGDGKRGTPLKIRGWVGIRTKSASGSGLWGLHTFRKGQLVEPFLNKRDNDGGLLPRNPHPEYARVHGEIHLDMCSPNFTKLGWNTQLESWTDVQKALRPILLALMKDAKNYGRAKKAGGAKAKHLKQKAKRMKEESMERISENIDGDAVCTEGRHCVLLGDGRHIIISLAHQPITYDENLPWDYNYRDESNELAIVVNTESNMWAYAEESKDPEKIAYLIGNMAILDSLYFCLVHRISPPLDTAQADKLRHRWHQMLYGVDENGSE